MRILIINYCVHLVAKIQKPRYICPMLVQYGSGPGIDYL